MRDVVWLVFACFMCLCVCLCVCFYPDEPVRWDAPLKNQKAKGICVMGGNSDLGPKSGCKSFPNEPVRWDAPLKNQGDQANMYDKTETTILCRNLGANFRRVAHCFMEGGILHVEAPTHILIKKNEPVYV